MLSAPEKALQERLGHNFADQALLQQALTHASASDGRIEPLPSYERLEFLGDRVLGLCIASMLHHQFPKADEGELSRRLSRLVCRETCVEIANEWQVERALRLSESDKRSGKTSPKSLKITETIKSDICEAILGAIYLDAGYAHVQGIIARFWSGRLLQEVAAQRDPKTTLQEWAQGQGYKLPFYREIGRTGPDHAPHFSIAVEVAELPPMIATGKSKREAERNAAALILEREGVVLGGTK